MTPVADELTPYLLVRIVDGRAEFAQWQVREGQHALALFLTEDNALNYAKRSLSGAGWQVVRPPRASVLEVLTAVHAAGVSLAVLDPDAEKAKRAFPIGEILVAVDIAGT
jgi:hypothetical protein